MRLSDRTCCSVICVGLLAFAFAPTSPLSAQEASDAELILRQNGVGTETAELIEFLQRLQPDAKRQEEIAKLIKQLSDTEFSVREAAFKKLPTFGDAARRLVTEASKSKDPEVSWRCEKILEQLSSEQTIVLRQSLTTAALQVLTARTDANATPAILQALPILPDEHTQSIAAQALWACADASHAKLLERSLDHKTAGVRAAVIVALEIAQGDASVDRIVPLLEAESALVQLAAARALIDRKPRESVLT